MVRLPKLFADSGDDNEDSGSRAGTTSVAGQVPVSNAAVPISHAAVPPATAARPAGLSAGRAGSDVSTQLQEIRDAMEELYAGLQQVNDRETSQEKVFNALYAELHDYKNDFIYE